MDSDFDDLEDLEDKDILESLEDYGCTADCGDDYEDVDYEKHLKDVTEYLKEEHPAIFADMILKDIIK